MTNEEAIARIKEHKIIHKMNEPRAIYISEALDMAIKALEQEPCEDCISRKSIKQKLQEQHDFFVNAYGGFSNLPLNDKSRVDEITNCIAIVVNEPPVKPQPKIGHWIGDKCSECGEERAWYGDNPAYCPDCGTKMEVDDNENSD